MAHCRAAACFMGVVGGARKNEKKCYVCMGRAELEFWFVEILLI